MKKVFVLLANGFEEVEAIGAIDLLRRAEIEVIMTSIYSEKIVTGAHGIPVIADTIIGEADFSDADALVLPGGLPGATNLNESEEVRSALVAQYEKGKLVAAICAAPLVLGGLGMLEGRKATCYPSFEPTLIGAKATGEAVETDGNVITGKGPGYVFDFALAIITVLRDESIAKQVASGLLLV